MDQGHHGLDTASLNRRLEQAMEEHRDLDSAIAALGSLPGADLLQLARLKRRKLRLRDEIQKIQDLLLPDIIA